MPESNRAYRIAVIPGDGIGKEVIPEGVRALEQAAKRHGFSLQLDWFDFSSYDYYEKHGRMLPEDWKERIGSHDAIFFGAVGWPAKIADHTSLWGSPLQFRREFDQYVNLRPVRLMPGVPGPLAHRKPGDIDFWVVRENTGGEYSSIGGRMFPGADRGFVDGNGIDEEATITNDTPLSRERGADERPGEAVLEERGQLRGHRAAHRRVDLLEDVTGRQPLAQPLCARADRGAGRVGGQHSALGVDGDDGPVRGRQIGLGDHSDRSGSREQAAGVAGAGQVIGDDRDNLGCACRHEWTTVPQNPRLPDPARRGGSAGARCILRR